MAGATSDPPASAPLDPLHDSWAVLLKTRRRDGSWVGTPVNLAVESERASFGTPVELRFRRTREVRYELEGFRPA